MLIQRQESYRKGIVASTLLNIASRSIGFINSLVLVYLFGTNTGTDSYFLVISTMGFVSSFMVGIITYVAIPEAMRIRQVKGITAEQAYLNFFIWSFLGIGLALASVILFAPIDFYSMFAKFSASELSHFRLLLMISCIVFPLNLLINLLVLILSSHKFFTIPMLVSVINSLVSITLVFVLKAQFGITAAIIAFATGSLINIAWVTYYLVRHLKWDFKNITQPSRSNWRNILLTELNIVPISFRSYVTIYMLSGLGAGVITAYNYGMQIALIPEIMIISQVTAVIGIKYNELSATNSLAAIDRLFQKSMRLLFFGLLPTGILIFLLAPELLEILFIFKNKSELQSLMLIATFMSCFAITLPFRALDVMVSSVLTAQQKIGEAVAFSFLLNCSIILLTFFAVKYYGLRGFFYLTVFVYAILIPVFYFFFTRKILPFIQIGQWAKSTLGYLLPMGAVATGVYFLKQQYLAEAGLWLTILIVTGIIVAAVLVLNRIIRYTAYSFDF